MQASICAERPEHQDLLKEVRTRLMMALELRNRISHGLIGITADPFGNRGDAHLETELNGEKRKHTYPETKTKKRRPLHSRYPSTYSRTCAEPTIWYLPDPGSRSRYTQIICGVFAKRSAFRRNFIPITPAFHAIIGISSSAA